ncbi:NAD(P)-binding protein [Fusarium pseudoanthophilum]|uniref:3-hydroxyisobutyrate dehydrogenase n=1 Tax=Fusarium pseudoanthophilum TaxID=48495 RepID=A0A8H5L536_9HYPO|nr:NAD(P)-binding protein [Fusarium pseudoanthophilum]
MTTYIVNDGDLAVLKGKTLVIIGGTTGIGRAALEAAVEQEANVILGDLNKKEGTSLMNKLGGRILFKSCDVSNWDQILDLFEAGYKKFGVIHSVLSNAGINTNEDLLDDMIDAQTGRLRPPSLKSIDVNLLGQLYVTKVALHYFSKWPGTQCQLVLTSSAGAFFPAPPIYMYCTAKAGVVGLMRALRSETAKRNVTINTVAPWLTVTPMLLADWLASWTLPKNTPSGVAKALFLPIVRPDLNGKSFFISGDEIIEFEDTLAKAEPEWMGQPLCENVREGQRILLGEKYSGSMGSLTNNSTKYGFIGLGVMGWGMANNIRSKIAESDNVCVCELNKERLGQWLAQAPGKAPLKVAQTPKEVVEHSDVVFTMLPAGPHVADVFTNPKTGILSADACHLKKKLFLECSTIDIETSLNIAGQVKKLANCVFVDAPVSGGVHGANTGALSLMVGCESDAVFERIKPILCLVGRSENIFHCGGPSAGLATKQINNYLSCITMIGTCEAMALGEHSGLEPAKLASVLRVSTGSCYNAGDQNPVKGVSNLSSASRDFEGGFVTEMAKGVLDMALDHADKIGSKTVLGNLVSDFYAQAAVHPKCKGKDFRSIYKLFSEDGGKDLELFKRRD